MFACCELAPMAASITTATWCAAGWEGPPPQAPARKKTPPKSLHKLGASLTVCVDQEDAGFVLLQDRTRNAVTDPEAYGFPSESFAKHLGQKATIRGISSPGEPRPVFKVALRRDGQRRLRASVEPQ
jgi:hypothetical protein